MSAEEQKDYLKIDEEVVRFVHKLLTTHMTDAPELYVVNTKVTLTILFDSVKAYSRIFDGMSLYSFNTWRLKHNIRLNYNKSAIIYILKKQYQADAAREARDESEKLAQPQIIM